ncbi:MAG: glyoxalase [Blastococcus sp.]|jgi:catechol 2,3-dioxygenase-like lactoylglutathione lyase family enzyme|nr:glyoxalase [Blastococcus sp.]
MTTWATGIETITLFVEDLAACERFYLDVFDVPVVHKDADSVVFAVGPVLVNLLAIREAPELVAPALVGADDGPARFVLTVRVQDVDAVAAEIGARGATLLNGPIDRPWGVRTASFRDPAGHVWEIAAPAPVTW